VIIKLIKEDLFPALQRVTERNPEHKKDLYDFESKIDTYLKQFDQQI
jgi:hypothetical protein